MEQRATNAHQSTADANYDSLYDRMPASDEVKDDQLGEDFPRRKITFPYQPRCGRVLANAHDRIIHQKYKSESCMRQVGGEITVRQLKDQWAGFVEKHGHTGYCPVGALISSKPRPHRESDASLDDMGSMENLTLVQFGKKKDSFDVGKEGSKDKKRHIAFADDLGKPLCDVKLIETPEEVPAEMQDSFIWTIIYERIVEDQQAPMATWLLDFPIPIDNMEEFEGKFRSQSIALENIELENEIPCRIFGTLRLHPSVKTKEPMLRLTTNDWQSFRDYETRLEPSECEDGYDLFTFDVDIPQDDGRIQVLEFSLLCIDGDERLCDNNSGKNYRILSEQSQMWWSQFE